MRRLTLLFLSFMLLLSGCMPYVRQPPEAETTRITVGFSQVGAESDWRVANTESMRESLSEENGFELLFDNARQEQENQFKAIRTFIQQDVDYIVLAPVTETGWESVLLAWGGERLVMKKRHRLNTAHTITTVGMLAAISGVLMVIELPLFFAPPFYKLDFSELPVLICAFSLGPVAGVVCEFLKVLIHLLLKGTSTAFVGDLANFLVGCSFVLPASILYQKLLSKKGAVASLALGTGVMTVFGSLFNAWFLIPRFAVMYGLPLDAIIAMGTQVNGAITDLSTLVLLAVVPFNLLKGVLVSVLTFFLYKRVERLFFRKKTAE